MPLETKLELVAGLRIVKKLFPDLPEAYAVPTNNMKYCSNNDKLISLLSWIALFFNIKDRNNVAVALKFSRQELPSLIISTDQGSVPSEVDKTIMDEFKTLTFQAFRKPKDINGHALAFYSLLAQQSWQPMKDAIMKIRDNHFFPKTTVDIKQKYLGLMDKWISFRSRVKRSHISKPSREEIASCFDLLLTGSKPNQKDVGKLEMRRAQYFANIARCCKTINGSKFFKSSLDSSTKGGDQIWQFSVENEDRFFLFHLRTRIKNVLAISEGAETYLKEGLVHLQALYDHAKDEDSFRQSFRFTWTGQTYKVNIPQNIKLTKTPFEWITEYAHETGQPKDELKQLSGILSKCWKKEDAIQCRLHSEVAILDFVLKRGIQMKYDVIGTAEPPCWACQEYLHFRGDDRNYIYRTERAEFPDDWLTLLAVGVTEDEFEKDCLARVCECTHALLKDVVTGQIDLEGIEVQH